MPSPRKSAYPCTTHKTHNLMVSKAAALIWWMIIRLWSSTITQTHSAGKERHLWRVWWCVCSVGGRSRWAGAMAGTARDGQPAARRCFLTSGLCLRSNSPRPPSPPPQTEPETEPCSSTTATTHTWETNTHRWTCISGSYNILLKV